MFQLTPERMCARCPIIWDQTVLRPTSKCQVSLARSFGIKRDRYMRWAYNKIYCYLLFIYTHKHFLFLRILKKKKKNNDQLIINGKKKITFPLVTKFSRYSYYKNIHILIFNFFFFNIDYARFLFFFFVESFFF